MTGTVVYEKRNSLLPKGWDNNYIMYAGELLLDDILIIGAKEVSSQYGDKNRHIRTT